MRVVFMGTPDFSVPSLEALADAYDVVAVYTGADKPRGRGRTPTPTPVKSVALDRGLVVRQPDSLRDPDVIRELAADEPDVVCVAAYGLLLPCDVLEIPTHGCLNVHASLLPRHRGAAPIHHAILDADAVTGISIMLMDEGLDTGPYSVTRSTPVDGKDVEALSDELSLLGADALMEALGLLADKALVWTSQDDVSATYASKITSAEVLLSPEIDASTALRRIRASTRSARSKIQIGDCVLDVTSAAPVSHVPLAAGDVRSDKTGLYLGFADATIRVEEVRPEGRGCMDGCSWTHGARLEPDTLWTAVCP